MEGEFAPRARKWHCGRASERARTRRLQSLRSQCTMTTKTTSEARRRRRRRREGRRGTPQATASAALGLGQRGHRTRIGPSRERRQHGGRQTATGRPRRRTDGRRDCRTDRGPKRGGSAGPMGLEFGLHRAERGGRGREGGEGGAPPPPPLCPHHPLLALANARLHLYAQCRKKTSTKKWNWRPIDRC